MGKFNVALLWLGAPLALKIGGLLPWWGVAAWMLSPFIAIALLGIGAGTIAWIMDICTGSRAIRGHSANSAQKSVTLNQKSVTLKLSEPAASSMAPSA